MIREFFDTSVLVAAFWGGHPHHVNSLRLLANATPATSACAAHTLAEFYSVTTSLPIRPAIPPSHALLSLEEIRSRLAIIELSSGEYFEVLAEAAEKRMTGGRVYDALLLQCARKCDAERIFTLNLKHFRELAGQALGVRILAP